MFLLTKAGFILVTIVYVGLFFRTLFKAADAVQRRWLIRISAGALVWAALISLLSMSGIFRDFDTLPPPFAIVVFVTLVSILWLVSRPSAGTLLRAIPPERLISLQSFRVFVEVLLWMLFVDGLVPEQMTFEGLNFDIAAGLTAPLVAWYVGKTNSRKLTIAWNVISLGLLINIVTIAILSAPLPFRVFMNEPANTIVAEFPVVWLPGLLVPLAYTLHILSLRQALSRQSVVA